MKRDPAYLLDIATICSNIAELMEGATKHQFLEEKRIHFSVVYEIAILGEIVKRLSSEFRETHPEIPWKQIAGMRDKLIHDYNQIDLNLTWQVANSQIPNLLEVILPLLPTEDSEELD
jgi:uncharacterized protein with HEPN domain